MKTIDCYLDQYDVKLFELFIEAYRNGCMGFEVQPRLIAQAFSDWLYTDTGYISMPAKA